MSPEAGTARTSTPPAAVEDVAARLAAHTVRRRHTMRRHANLADDTPNVHRHGVGVVVPAQLYARVSASEALCRGMEWHHAVAPRTWADRLPVPAQANAVARLLRLLQDRLQGRHAPLPLLIQGHTGSGKTTLLRLVEDQLGVTGHWINACIDKEQPWFSATATAAASGTTTTSKTAKAAAHARIQAIERSINALFVRERPPFQHIYLLDAMDALLHDSKSVRTLLLNLLKPAATATFAKVHGGWQRGPIVVTATTPLPRELQTLFGYPRASNMRLVDLPRPQLADGGALVRTRLCPALVDACIATGRLPPHRRHAALTVLQRQLWEDTSLGKAPNQHMACDFFYAISCALLLRAGVVDSRATRRDLALDVRGAFLRMVSTSRRTRFGARVPLPVALREQAAELHGDMLLPYAFTNAWDARDGGVPPRHTAAELHVAEAMAGVADAMSDMDVWPPFHTITTRVQHSVVARVAPRMRPPSFPSFPTQLLQLQRAIPPPIEHAAQICKEALARLVEALVLVAHVYAAATDTTASQDVVRRFGKALLPRGWNVCAARSWLTPQERKQVTAELCLRVRNALVQCTHGQGRGAAQQSTVALPVRLRDTCAPFAQQLFDAYIAACQSARQPGLEAWLQDTSPVPRTKRGSTKGRGAARAATASKKPRRTKRK